MHLVILQLKLPWELSHFLKLPKMGGRGGNQTFLDSLMKFLNKILIFLIQESMSEVIRILLYFFSHLTKYMTSPWDLIALNNWIWMKLLVRADLQAHIYCSYLENRVLPFLQTATARNFTATHAFMSEHLVWAQ